MPGPPKFQITSRKWNIAAVVGSILILAIGFGGLFYVQQNVDPTGGVMLALVIAFGILTALLFISPGALYPFRKRTKIGKKIMPGGTMTWIRSHMYLPILALVAAIVHASMVPFLTHLTSGVILIVLGVLVSIGGLARHHMIGLKKEALNVNVAINKMAQGQPRHFRELVNDFVENRRPLPEIEAEVAKLDSGEQVIWREIRKMSDEVAKNFPRSGGQTSKVLQFQSWRALHPIITILFFAVLAWHVWDVLGGTQAAFGSDKTAFVASNSCADCHDDVVQDWKLSSMADAQIGTIMEAQLPVTIGENEKLAEALGEEQQALFDIAAKTCINCHAPVGAPFAQDINTLLPLNAEGSATDGGVAVSGGNDAVNSDGIGCITCHTQEAPPAELAGFGPLPVAKQAANNFGIQYGPLFTDPDPVPIPKHGMNSGTDDWWSTTVGSSQLCGACHNVKVDIDGDGLSPVSDDNTSTTDADGNFTLDQNELDNVDGTLDDLVLQTTYDEWQDYVAGFEARVKDDPRNTLEAPLGCTDCHMPTTGDGEQAIVDFSPGFIPKPDRTYRSHMFVGVDYDLDTEHYDQSGFPDNALQKVLDARQALLESAVTLEVVDKGVNASGQDVQSVVVQNNLLGHNFPTGFAFARQFWLEVSAKTADGQEVCLVKPSSGIDTPCSSGVLESAQDELRQCDPVSIQQALATDPTLNGQPIDPATVGNVDIKFSAAFPANDCDPWLTNYQKILTDGDPQQTGTFTEVVYQSFLPDIVKLRTRVATQQVMRTLDPIREVEGADGQLQDRSSDSYDYVFNTASLPPGTEIVVTAKLRFRHLPPYFVEGLAEGDAEQERIPEDAKITDPEALLKNMVITDVVTAETGAGAVLACDGPQNEPGASVFSCIGNNPDGEQGAIGGSSDFVGTLPPQEAGSGIVGTVGGSAGAAAAAAAGGVALVASTVSTAIGPRARATLRAVNVERPMTVERGVIEARKAQALRDLVEVERQRQAGEIDPETADHLTKIYEAEVVAALEPEPAQSSSRHLSLGRWDRTTGTLTLVGIIVVACVAIVAVVVGHSDRGTSGTVQSTVSTLPGGGRDLSTVTDEEMEAVIAENPSITPMRLSLIERYLREGNLEKAKEHAELALDNNPSAVDRQQALKYLGWTTAALGDPQAGADLLQQSITLNPTDLDAKWFLANVELTQLDDAAGAVTLLREILDQPISDTQRASVEAKLKEAEQAS